MHYIHKLLHYYVIYIYIYKYIHIYTGYIYKQVYICIYIYIDINLYYRVCYSHMF